MTSPKIAVLWTRMGPYHFARMNALGSVPGFNVRVVELCRHDSQHLWDGLPFDIHFSHETLVDGFYEEINKDYLTGEAVKALNRIDPDAVVIAGYGTKPMRAAGKWAKQNGRLSILMSESHWKDRKRNLLIEFLKGRWICRYFDAAFVGGERNAAYLERLGFPRNRIWRGYDVVDNAYFDVEAGKVRLEEVKWREKLQFPERYFLYVGRFAPAKNLEGLLRAYQIYRKQVAGKAWELLLVGSGPLEHQLKETVEKEKIDGVHLHGFKQIDELPPYYALASCFVLPSISEPWGLVVNEAMASSLPVLASDRCGCLPELLNQGRNGYVFDPLDTSELARLMEKISSAGACLSEFGAESRKIVSPFTPESWARSLVDCVSMTLQRSAQEIS